MLPTLIFCVLLTAAQTSGSYGAAYDRQAPSVSPNFMDLPSFDSEINFAQPTISHKSFIEHASPGTGSSRGSGGSLHSTGTRSSTLLNKAIAQQGAGPDPAIRMSSYNNVPAPDIISVSVSSSSDDDTHINIPFSPGKIPTATYANDGILSLGQLGTSLGNDVISIPNAVSLNYVTGHGATASNSAAPVKVSSSLGLAESSFMSSLGAIEPSTIPAPDSITLRNDQEDYHFQIEAPSVNYAPESGPVGPVSNQASVKVSSSDGLAESSFLSSLGAIVEKPSAIPSPDYITLRKIAVVQNEAPSVNYATGSGPIGPVSDQASVKVSSSDGLAESSFLSSLGAIVEKPSAIPSSDSITLRKIAVVQNEAPSVNYAAESGPIGPVANQAPVKVSSSVGLAESSFLSSLGANVEQPSTIPDSISLRKIAAVQNEAPSTNYATENGPVGAFANQAATFNPTTLTSQTSIDKYLSTPASDLLGLLGNGYNSNPNGILSTGFLGAPISSIFGNQLSANGLSSISNIANNGNFGLSSAPVVMNEDDSLNKFGTVIQHTSLANSDASMPFNGINNNNLFNGLNGNGIFADPIGFPNGLFGNTYNYGMNGFGGGNFAADNIFSKYLWR